MDFDSILDKWENRRDRAKVSQTGTGPVKPENSGNTIGSDWLESYPPDADIIAAKDKEEKPPVSGGKSIWLRRSHQDVLDLHGMTGREAREEMARFIRSMRRRDLRKGLVVHGKGLHSVDGSVLAPLVREYLEMSTEIGEFGRAARKDGGSGATWFILRQRSR
jgi:DNA-nicking Smr family endonuclease